MNNRGEAACEFQKQGFNCGQSVLLAFAGDLGLDPRTAARFACCLGGGFSQTGGICGAVSAACLAVSGKHGRDDPSREGEAMERQKRTYAMVRKLLDAFAEEFGAVDCPALLERGLAASGPKQDDKFLCRQYVRRAAELAEEMEAL